MLIKPSAMSFAKVSLRRTCSVGIVNVGFVILVALSMMLKWSMTLDTCTGSDIRLKVLVPAAGASVGSLPFLIVIVSSFGSLSGS